MNAALFDRHVTVTDSVLDRHERDTESGIERNERSFFGCVRVSDAYVAEIRTLGNLHSFAFGLWDFRHRDGSMDPNNLILTFTTLEMP